MCVKFGWIDLVVFHTKISHKIFGYKPHPTLCHWSYRWKNWLKGKNCKFMTFNSHTSANKIVKANVESFWWMIIQDILNIFRISICKLKILSKLYITSQDVALYYNVKICLKNLLTNKRFYNVLKTLIMVFNDFFNILSSLNLIQIISHVSIIYYEHCHECFWITCNINISFYTKTWK